MSGNSKFEIVVDMSDTPLFDSLPPVDKRDPLPRHLQVQQLLRNLVVSGRLKPGDKIPAELDLAAALGVSKMTVNKALLALAADGLFIREVGRGTFVAASNGAAKAACPRILICFTEGARNILDSDYYGTLYRGIVEYLTAHDDRLSIEISMTPLANSERYPNEVSGRLLIAPHEDNLPTILRLWEDGHPLVVIGASWPSLLVPSVDSDNVGGAMSAVKHLIDRGHRRIALLYAEEKTANVQDRILGYRRALQQANLPYDPACEVRSEREWAVKESVKQQLQSLLRGSDPVTAIFAVGHYLALEAKNAIREADLRIPEDVAVVGYDDPVAAQLVFPPLTTVRQPLHEMGRRAAERLMRLIHGQDSHTPIREVLPAELIHRKSSELSLTHGAR